MRNVFRGLVALISSATVLGLAVPANGTVTLTLSGSSLSSNFQLVAVRTK